MNVPTLAKAIKEDCLQDFLAQEEARSVGPVRRKDVDCAVLIAGTTTASANNGPSETATQSGKSLKSGHSGK